MFPVDLLMKAGEMLLGEAAKQAGERFSRPDSRKQFGKDLLSFYEDLEEYASTCSRLIEVLERPDFGRPGHAGFARELDEANDLSAKLVEVLGRLIKVLWPVLPRPYSRDYDLVEGRPGRRAEHRAAVLSIYEEQLTALVAVTYQTEMDEIWLARSLMTFSLM